MTEDVENLILHQLKAIPSDLHSLKLAVSDLASQVISVRKQLVNMDSSEIRQDELIASLQADIDRIKHTLGIADYPGA